jgi:hypothetical protein
MKKNSLLLIADRGVESPLLLLDIATSIADTVIWVASEPPDLINAILSSSQVEDRVSVLSFIQSSKYRHVSANNLSEIGILISKLSEGMEDFVVIMSAIPELLLIHGLEKTYMFLVNVIGKTTSQNRKFFGSLIHGAQAERDEIMISRLFSIILRYKKFLENNLWRRNLIFETPLKGLDSDVVELYFDGDKLRMPRLIKNTILEEMSNEKEI